MGKRELVLVLSLIVVGTVVYHVTAPPPSADRQGFSFSRLIDLARRHVSGNRADAELTTAASFPVSSATTELRLAISALSESLTITGEDRDDIAAVLHVSSNGYDDAEAQQLAKATTLSANEAGGRIAFDIKYPREGRQHATLVLRVPARMRVNLSRYNGKLTITNTADVELSETRGEISVRELTGRLSVSHRGGDLTVEDVGALKLTVRGADVRIKNVRGDATIQSQAGELRGGEFGGAVDIEANGTDVSLEALQTTSAPVHVKATNGSVTLAGVASETRVEGNNAEIEIGVQSAAPIAVFSEGRESIEITPSRGGYQLDAVASAGGAIRLPAGLPEVIVEGQEQRAKGAVQGGGPTLTLRATSGDIVVRSADAPRRPTPPPPPPPPKPPAPKAER